jgi:short subunit dehydrogenase-like uncharacterized protein
MPEWLLYGANGYTGRLIAEEARRRGLRPVLAGRREGPVRALAERLGCEWRVFDLDDSPRLDTALGEVGTILLAAGPFSVTSARVVDACLRTGAKYLDITGEIDVFERILGLGDRARERGSVLLPGVGFDVVPSDCLAADLASGLANATHLELAIASLGSHPSHGTLSTMIEGMPNGSARREAGVIRREALLVRSRRVVFHDRARQVVSIPWGDVSTAYYSTGIRHITVWMAVGDRARRLVPLLRWVVPLLGLPVMQRIARAAAARGAPGPSQAVRARSRSELWGQVSTADGRSLEATLTTPNAYSLTAATAVECAERVAAGRLQPGAYTPSQAFGPHFITEFDGCSLRR